jgi:hypothetical protein
MIELKRTSEIPRLAAWALTATPVINMYTSREVASIKCSNVAAAVLWFLPQRCCVFACDGEEKVDWTTFTCGVDLLLAELVQRVTPLIERWCLKLAVGQSDT